MLPSRGTRAERPPAVHTVDRVSFMFLETGVNLWGSRLTGKGDAGVREGLTAPVDVR